jgi:hypothetical protein
MNARGASAIATRIDRAIVSAPGLKICATDRVSSEETEHHAPLPGFVES